MSSSRERSVTPPDPDARPPGWSETGAILVPLILGGAIIVAILVLWEAHRRNWAIAETARAEIAVRKELRAAYDELRGRRPEQALSHAVEAGRMMDEQLHFRWRTDYAELKIARNLVEAESLLMIDRRANAPAAERLFNEALGWMSHASGGLWSFGMLGRARTRYELGRYGDALADFDMLLDRNASFGAAYYWRSLTRSKLGDARGAAADERRARALDSWPPLRDFICGWSVWKSGFSDKRKQ